MADDYGVTHRALRHYEHLGLLAPDREGQRRLYHRRERTRLALILRGRRLGFSLEEIATILDMYDDQPGEVGQLRYLLTQIGEHEAAHVEALSATITDLGGTPVEEASYDFGYTDATSFLTTAVALENVGVSAYAGAAPSVAVLAPSLVATALGAIAGGAIGNVIDRVRFGAVVDFLHAHAFGWSWYVFNVADAAIVCGVGALVLDGFLPRSRLPAQPVKQ